MLSINRVLPTLAILLLLIPSVSNAKTAVWKASKDGNTVYLGGTVHLLAKSDYPLPNAFETAYKDSQEIVLETDISAAMDLGFQMKSMKIVMFQDDRTLSTVVSDKNYKALSELLETKGLPISMFEKFTPAGVSLTLAALEMQKMGMAETLGVDKHFYDRAQSDSKKAHFLETTDEQLSFIESMNSLDPDKIIESAIEENLDFQAKMDSILQAWKNGDLDALEETGIDEMQSEFPKLYQVLLVQRNNAWIKEINRFIESPEVEFILVGALHMAGDDGLLVQLKSQGFKVEQLD